MVTKMENRWTGVGDPRSGVKRIVLYWIDAYSPLWYV